MEEDHRNQGAVQLLEERWFFGNSLIKGRPKNIARSNSEPTTSFVEKKDGLRTSTLLKTPSLPSRFGKRGDNSDDEDDKYGPRMSYLIRQAMPCSKLSRAPSLPPCRIKKEVTGPQDVLPRGPTMPKLTRRSSLDPSLLTSKDLEKGTKISKDLLERRQLEKAKSINLQRSISLKSLTDKEVQGFQDLGFTFDKEDLSPSVVDKLARLDRKEEAIEEGEGVGKDVKRNPSLSEAWNATQTQWAYSPPAPTWIDTKTSDEDMKEQIKFWARAVASNVHLEC